MDKDLFKPADPEKTVEFRKDIGITVQDIREAIEQLREANDSSKYEMTNDVILTVLKELRNQVNIGYVFPRYPFLTLAVLEYLIERQLIVDQEKEGEPLPRWRGNMKGLEPYQGWDSHTQIEWER